MTMRTFLLPPKALDAEALVRATAPAIGLTIPEDDDSALAQVFGAVSLWMLQTIREALDATA